MSRAIGAVNGLHLVTLEDASNFILMHGDEARERHGEVVAQPEVARARGGFCPPHEDFKEKLISLLAIFTHEGFDIFDGGRFDGGKAVFFVHASYDIHDVLPLFHLPGEKIPCAFGNACFDRRHRKKLRKSKN